MIFHWLKSEIILTDALFPVLALTGKFPAILDDVAVGESARDLYNDAQRMIDRIIEEKWIKAMASSAFCRLIEDDLIEVYTDQSRTKS